MGIYQLSEKVTDSFEFSNCARTAITVGMSIWILFGALTLGVAVKSEKGGGEEDGGGICLKE